MRFFVGLHHPDAGYGLSLAGIAVCISMNALRRRVEDHGVPYVGAGDPEAPWFLDSGAFTSLTLGRGRHIVSPEGYAESVRRYVDGPCPPAAVSTLDWMCEPRMLALTGASVAEHIRRTVEGFDRVAATGISARGRGYLMPVLQGWNAGDYVRCLDAYGDRIARGAWVGVGTLCKRQGRPAVVAGILDAILRERPDLRLHAFGLKLTALKVRLVRDMLASADSMAWSYAARREGRDANDPLEAYRYVLKVMGMDEAEHRAAVRARILDLYGVRRPAAG